MIFKEIYEKAIQDLIKVYHKKILNGTPVVCDRVRSNVFYELSRNSMYLFSPENTFVERFYKDTNVQSKTIEVEIPSQEIVDTLKDFQSFMNGLDEKKPDDLKNSKDLIEKYQNALQNPKTEILPIEVSILKSPDDMEFQVIDLTKTPLSEDLLKHTCQINIDQAVSNYRFYHHDLMISSINIIEIEENDFCDIIIQIS